MSRMIGLPELIRMHSFCGTIIYTLAVMKLKWLKVSYLKCDLHQKFTISRVATRRHLSSNAYCFFGTASRLTLFQIISLITVFCI